MTQHQPPSTVQEWIQRADSQRQRTQSPSEDEIDPTPWTDRIRQAAQKAAESPPEDLDQNLIQLYGATAGFAHDTLQPMLLNSPHRLFGQCGLEFRQDVYDHMAGTCDSEPPEGIVGPTPDPVGGTSEEWSQRIKLLCEWLDDRAEAYHVAKIAMTQRVDIAAYTKHQILLNCYSASASIAAAACRWATTADARGNRT